MLTIMMAVMTLYVLICAQSIWYYGQLFLFERKVGERFSEMERLEREITREQFSCAAQNPDATEILMERERLRLETLYQPDSFRCRRLWAAHLGGDPSFCDAISEEEDTPCDTAE